MSKEEQLKIRRRKSYKLLKEIHDIFSNPHTGDTERLQSMFSVLDREQIFGSQTAANYARESLDLLTEDLENGINEE